MDAVYIPLLVWSVRWDFFLTLKWSLVKAAALARYGTWNWCMILLITKLMD